MSDNEQLFENPLYLDFLLSDGKPLPRGQAVGMSSRRSGSPKVSRKPLIDRLDTPPPSRSHKASGRMSAANPSHHVGASKEVITFFNEDEHKVRRDNR